MHAQASEEIDDIEAVVDVIVRISQSLPIFFELCALEAEDLVS